MPRMCWILSLGLFLVWAPSAAASDPLAPACGCQCRAKCRPAPAYALSFAAGRPVATDTAETIADGMACRTPDPEAVRVILEGASRIVSVDDDEIRAAMRYLFSDTHNVAEGAGAAALAALLQERVRMRGRRVALILSGGNVDREVFVQALAQNLGG